MKIAPLQISPRKNTHLIMSIIFFVISMLIFTFVFTSKDVHESIKKKSIITDNQDKKEHKSPVSLLFTGDVMLDRAIAKKAEKEGYEAILDGFSKYYNSVDAVVINHEGAVTYKESVSRYDYSDLRFTFSPLTSKVLRSFNIKAVSLANNHSLDFGTKGYHESIKILTDSDIIPFGSPLNNIYLSAYLPIGTNTICLVGYHDLFTHNANPILYEIRLLEEKDTCSYIVVMPHWGVEYSKSPSKRQIELARQFIDYGADIVIGSHPHVIQPIEIYNNKPIFYSLGNHIFDQKLTTETEQGLTVRLGLSATSTKATLIPSIMKNFEVEVPSDEMSSSIIREIAEQSSLSEHRRKELINSHSLILTNIKGDELSKRSTE